MGDLSQNFSREEFACKCGCGFDTVDSELLDELETVRAHFRAPVTINSGCRCPDHNKAVGGSNNSQHVYGRAADFVVFGVHADRVAEFLLELHEGRYGIGQYIGRTHLDTRPNGPARWDMR